MSNPTKPTVPTSGQSITEITTALGPNGANADGALSDLVDVGAANLEGNGEALNRTLTGFSQAVETLATNRDDLFSSLDNLQAFTSALATVDAQVWEEVATALLERRQLEVDYLSRSKGDTKTLPLGVADFSSQYSSDTAGVFAFTTLAMIPALIFFLTMQRRIVSGLQGAVKG